MSQWQTLIKWKWNDDMLIIIYVEKKVDFEENEAKALKRKIGWMRRIRREDVINDNKI